MHAIKDQTHAHKRHLLDNRIPVESSDRHEQSHNHVWQRFFPYRVGRDWTITDIDNIPHPWSNTTFTHAPVPIYISSLLGNFD